VPVDSPLAPIDSPLPVRIRGTTGPFAFIALATIALILGRTTTANFVTWDDEQLIYRLDPNLNPPTLRGLANFWEGPRDMMFIPLVYSTWWGLANLGWMNVADASTGSHINPTLFHLANLLLHFFSVLAVYRILLTLFDRPWAACVGAIYFCIHPAQVEPVAWATGMKDVLSGALGLWAISVYLDACGVASDDRRRQLRYAMASGLYLLALLAKPSTVTVPLIAAVLAWLKIDRRLSLLLRDLLPWLIAGGVVAFVAGFAQPPIGQDPMPMWARPLIASDALAFYLYKLVWPARLSIDYCRQPARMLAQGWLYWTWILPAACAYALYRLRSRVIWAAAAVFVCGTLPVLGLFRFRFQDISTVADRYLYLAMLGPAVAVTWGVARGGLRATIPVLVVLVALGCRSFVAAGVWHDSISLYENAIAVHPESAMAHNNLGSVYAWHGQNSQAIEQWQIALMLKPDLTTARDNLRDALSGRLLTQ
jgi:tetratricopeptide (TPR) repeat protein